MISEFKMSEKYGKYMLNILVKTDSTEAEIFVVGIEVEDGQYDILEGGDKAVATFKLPAKTDDPVKARGAFAAWLDKNGTSQLDAAILGEDVPAVVEVVEEEKPVVKKETPKPKAKTQAKPKAKPAPKKQVEEELPADSDGVEKD